MEDKEDAEGCRMAVNGIRKDYTEVLDNRKGESIIKEIGCQHTKKEERDSEGTG